MTRIDDPWWSSPSPEPSPGDPARRARLEQRRHEDRERRRFLTWSALGTLLPGAGLVAAGRRRAGWTILAVLGLSAVGVAAFLVQGGRQRLLELGLDSGVLRAVGIGLAALAAAWLVVAVVSRQLLEPRGAATGTRMLSALLVVATASLVLTPVVVGSRYAFSSRDVVEIFADDGEDAVSLTKPTQATKVDPWAGKPRVNVLILGSDAGDDREGTRTDSVILASIDTVSGETTLFSLPRNLMRVPFPVVAGPAAELRRSYPRGFVDPGGELESMLNAVYTNVPAAHPEVFEDVVASGGDAGAEAVKLAVMGALGVDVDYYVMVNLEGFERIVDALGGIDLDVPYRIPIGSITRDGGGCTQPQGWIEPGQQQLDGFLALTYARARCIPGLNVDDYERVRRQRCVIGAVADAADPVTILTKYAQITSAATGLITTDIPQSLLPAFVELGLRVKGKEIRSIAFTSDVITTSNPDYASVQALVQAALQPPPSPSATATPAAPSSPAASTPPPPSAPAPTPSDPGKISTDTGQAQSLDELC